MSCSYRIVRDCQDDLVADFSTEVSLVAIDSEVPGDEARRWWNCKDTPVLDDLVAAAPRLRLGKTIDDHFDDVPGPARRVFALLFLRGTTPEYVVPRLGDELISEILAAYLGGGDDAPGTQEADLAEVAAFLAAHRVAGVLTDEDDEPFSHGRASPARLAQRPGHAPGLRKCIDGQDQLTRRHIEAAHHPAGTGTADEATEDGNEASAPTDAGPHRAQPPLDGRCKP